MARLRFAPAWQPSLLRSAPKAKAGGKGIRTPDFQLAKLALYQLSYAPTGNFEFRLPIFDCKGIKAECRMSLKRVDIRHALFLLSVLL